MLVAVDFDLFTFFPLSGAEFTSLQDIFLDCTAATCLHKHSRKISVKLLENQPFTVFP